MEIKYHKLNNSTPTSDDCFISVVFDEWLKNSHCLDSPQQWDANPRKPFAFTEIKSLFVHKGLRSPADLGELMVSEAFIRIDESLKTSGIPPSILIQTITHIVAGRNNKIYASVAEANLQSYNMPDQVIDLLMRGVSLYLNVISGAWPFKYDIPSRAPDNENPTKDTTGVDQDSEGGQQ